LSFTNEANELRWRNKGVREAEGEEDDEGGADADGVVMLGRDPPVAEAEPGTNR